MTSTIFVLGSPATGKTTFINYFMEAAAGKKKSVRVVMDNVCLWSLCPQQIGDGYYYDEGMLVLENESRERILSQVMRMVTAETLTAQGECDYCLVEFTSPKWEESIKDYFLEVMELKPSLVSMSVEYGELGKRNREREAVSRVPEEYIAMFESNRGLRDIYNAFDKVWEVSNQADKERLKEKAVAVISDLEG